MTSPHEQIKKEHNSGPLKEKIQELAVRYAKADEQSQKLNEERAKIREEIEALGHDTKAWQDEISRAKKSLTKKDGYDESAMFIRDALGNMDMEDLFAHVARKEKEKQAKREEKAAAKKAAAEPAAQKSVGEQQAAAIMAANKLN